MLDVQCYYYLQRSQTIIHLRFQVLSFSVVLVTASNKKHSAKINNPTTKNAQQKGNIQHSNLCFHQEFSKLALPTQPTKKKIHIIHSIIDFLHDTTLLFFARNGKRQMLQNSQGTPVLAPLSGWMQLIDIGHHFLHQNLSQFLSISQYVKFRTAISLKSKLQ